MDYRIVWLILGITELQLQYHSLDGGSVRPMLSANGYPGVSYNNIRYVALLN